ncbi:MAG: homoserine kinase [Actinomycetota bacterium]
MSVASAPASSANLGPGFDILALALELRCSVTAAPSADWTVEHIGPESPAGDGDMVLDAARKAVGRRNRLRLTVENHIPIGRGLGSSAAAAAAGAAAAWRAIGDSPTDRRVFDLVADVERHPDNAAAAVYGGLVLCTPDGEVHRLPLHPRLVPLVAVPHQRLATTEARAALDRKLPRDMAIRSLGRVASLIAGLLIGDEVLLAGARGDEMHEAPRNHLRPGTADLIEVARTAGASHACWSGAGPSVLALVETARLGRVRQALEAALVDGHVIAPTVAHTGLV